MSEGNLRQPRACATDRVKRCGLLLLALVAAFAMVGRARAQQDDDDDDEKPAAAAPAQQVWWGDQNFEQWVFQNQGNYAGARKRLDTLLALQAEDIDRACKLTETQKKKLLLTGRGDIKRFFDRYEKVKQKFELVKRDQQKMQEIWQEINPLQMTLQAGLFHEDSLLGKSLHNTLSSDQYARYDTIARERRAFRHRANIELAVIALEQGMPLRDEQRRAFIALLANLTKPPRKPSAYEYQVIMYQIGRVPEEKLKPLFDEAQWKVVNRQLTQFKGMAQWLKQSGQLPEDEDEVSDARLPGDRK